MRILGIEFGTWSLKAVEMESRFRRMDILDFHEVRLPLEMMNPSDSYRRAITQLMARLPSHPDKIVTSLPPSQTALRFLPVPIKNRKKVEKMFRFELQDSVPFQLDQAIVEHHLMPQKDSTVVFAAIAPEKHVQSHVEWLQSIGVDPDWLTFEGMGLINLFLLSQQEKKKSKTSDENPEGPTLLLDIGHHKTNLSIYEGDRLEFFRSIAWGGSAITQSLSIALGISSEEAERVKINELKLDTTDKTELKPDHKEILLSSLQAFSPFLADINHSLVAYRTLYQKKISSSLITGGTSKAWGIESYLSQCLSIPVKSFHPFSQLNLKEELRGADECRFGEPVGRAMVFARKVPLLYNFRRQAAAKGTSLAEISSFVQSPNVQRLFLYSGILLAVLFLHVHIATHLAQNENSAVKKELNKVLQSTFSNVPTPLKKTLTKNPEGLKKFIAQKNNELKQKLKMVSKERVPMTNLVRDISRAFPPNVKVDVNNLSLDDRAFLIEGVLYEGSLNGITENLKQITSLAKVTITTEGQTADGQRFTYRGEIIGR